MNIQDFTIKLLAMVIERKNNSLLFILKNNKNNHSSFKKELWLVYCRVIVQVTDRVSSLSTPRPVPSTPGISLIENILPPAALSNSPD